MKLSDGGGLYLLVGKAGKCWRLDYRMDGKRKTLTIGYPEISLADRNDKSGNYQNGARDCRTSSILAHDGAYLLCYAETR